MDTDGHDPSLFVSVRLSGSPIARDLEKFIEVFTEGVKCWRIDSVGHGRTQSVSLFVGSTERKSDRERLQHFSALKAHYNFIYLVPIRALATSYCRKLFKGYLRNKRSFYYILTKETTKPSALLAVSAQHVCIRRSLSHEVRQ